MAFEDIQLEDVKKVGVTQPTIPGAVDLGKDAATIDPPETQSEPPVAPPVEPTPTPTNTDTPKESVFNIKEKTQGKFESFEDLWNDYEAISNQPKSEPLSLKDDYIKGLVDYYTKTGDIKPYVDAMSKNYDEMSAESILRESYREKYPKLSDAQFEKLFRKELGNKYGINEDNYDDEEAELANALMENDAEKLRLEFKERQNKFAAPPDTPQVDPKEVFEEWKQVVEQDKFVDKFKKEPKFTLKYDNSEFNIEVQEANDVLDAALNDRKIFQNFIEGKGNNAQINFEKFLKTYYYSKNPEAFEKRLIEFGKNLGQGKILDDLQNPTKLDNVNKPTRGEVTGDWKEEFFQAAKQTLKK